jgi:hypothetical protein
MLQEKDGAFDRQRQRERRRDNRSAILFFFGTNQYTDRGERQSNPDKSTHRVIASEKIAQNQTLLRMKKFRRRNAFI